MQHDRDQWYAYSDVKSLCLGALWWVHPHVWEAVLTVSVEGGWSKCSSGFLLHPYGHVLLLMLLFGFPSLHLAGRTVQSIQRALPGSFISTSTIWNLSLPVIPGDLCCRPHAEVEYKAKRWAFSSIHQHDSDTFIVSMLWAWGGLEPRVYISEVIWLDQADWKLSG